MITLHQCSWTMLFRAMRRLEPLPEGEYEKTVVATFAVRKARSAAITEEILGNLLLKTESGYLLSHAHLAAVRAVVLSTDGAHFSSRLKSAYKLEKFGHRDMAEALTYMVQNKHNYTTITDLITDWSKGNMAAINFLGETTTQQLNTISEEESQIGKALDTTLGVAIRNKSILLALNTAKTKIWFVKKSYDLEEGTLPSALLEQHAKSLALEIFCELYRAVPHLVQSRHVLTANSVANSIAGFDYEISRYLVRYLLAVPANKGIVLSGDPKEPRAAGDDANPVILKELQKLLYFCQSGVKKQLYCLKNTETKEVFPVDDWGGFYTTHSIVGTVLNQEIYNTDEFWEKRKVSKDYGITRPGIFEPKLFGKYCETIFPRYCPDNVGNTPKLYSNLTNEYCLHYRDLEEMQRSDSDDISAWQEFCVRLKDPSAFKTWVWRLFDAKDVGRQALYLRGHGADGKSQVAKVLSEALGEDMTTAWDGSGANNFPYEDLTRKRLIVIAERAAMWEIFKSPVFKVVTGGDRQQIQQKGKRADTYDFTGTKVLIITNDFPFATDDTPTLTRIVYVEMEHRGSSKESTEWPEQLREQLPAFLRHCKGVAACAQSLDEDGNIQQLMPLSSLATTPRTILKDCAADIIMQRGFAINTLGIQVLLSEVRKNRDKSGLLGLLTKAVISGDAAVAPGVVSDLFSKIDLTQMSVAVANELKLRGCIESGGGYVPPATGAGRVAIVANTSAVTIATPTPMEEEIDLDKLVSGAMNQTELSLD